MMIKRNTFYHFFFFALLAVLYAVFTPGALRQMEATDFFVCDSEFFQTKLGDMPGISSWLNNYLLQFFCWPVVGALIQALILALASFFCSLIPQAMGRKGYEELSILLPVLLLWLVPFNMNVYLQTLFFFVFLWGGLSLKSSLLKMIYLPVIGFLGLLFTTWSLLCFAILVVAVETLVRKRQWGIAVGALLGLAFSICGVYLSSSYIAFVPFESRFFYSPTPLLEFLPYIALYVVAVALMFVPRLKTKNRLQLVPTLLMCMVFGMITTLNLTSEKIKFTETFYRYAYLADHKEWSTLLAEIPHEETARSKMSLCYSLLAESALGTLPENVFTYPINDPENFLFHHDMQKQSCIFNRQFYDNLGIYDEAFRLAFEFGVMTPEGCCFSSMRQMAHYAILDGNYRLADKYLTLLEASSTNGSWAAAERQLMTRPVVAEKRKSEYKDTYINVYPLNSEMVRQLGYNPKNQKALDYLLVGLLLQKELQKFAIIMNGFPIYKDKPLPKAYKEAAAMFGGDEKYSLHKQFTYPKEYDEQFQQFYQKKEQSTNIAEFASFMSTYWYYFFFEQSNSKMSEETRYSKATS